MTQYTGTDRRRTSDNTIMFMQELQRIAEISASTNTNVSLLRIEVSDIKKSVASCDDLDEVEKKITDHIEEHKEVQRMKTESKRWNIGTVIAVAGIAFSVFLDWLKQGGGK